MSYCQQCGNQLSGEGVCSRCGSNGLIEPQTNNGQYQGFNRISCPMCGYTDLHISTETNIYTDGKNYSLGLGCFGFILCGAAGLIAMGFVGPLVLFFAPLGLMCGLCGRGQKTYSENSVYWICKRCGHKFEKNENIEVEEEMENQRLNTVLGRLNTVLAVTSLIFGIISLFLFPILTGFLAIILGSAALCVKGRSSGTAIAGIVLGFISFAVFTIFLFMATH